MNKIKVYPNLLFVILIGFRTASPLWCNLAIHQKAVSHLMENGGAAGKTLGQRHRVANMASLPCSAN